MNYIKSLLVLFLFQYSVLSSAQSDWWTEKPAGLYNNTTFGIVSFRGNLFTGIQTAFGYKLNPHIAFGGGAGLERYTDMPTYDTLKANLSMLPVFAEVRYTVLKKRVSPVVAVKGGYKILLNVPSSQLETWTYTVFPGFYWIDYSAYNTYTRGGFFITGEAGVKAIVWKRFNLYLSIDYSFWSIAGDRHLWKEEHLGGNPSEPEEIEVSSTVAYTDQFMVRLGFGF